jgi:large subunit ribosomal protein L30
MMAKTAAKSVTGKIKITLDRSTISQKPAKRATVRSLGLKKVHSSVVQDASPAILGMVASVQHLVSVEEAK